MEKVYEKIKVAAYITRKNAGQEQLLVFLSEGFEADGFQVPGGGVDAGETLEQALFREIREESGLQNLRLERMLGDLDYTFDDVRWFKRYFFHLTAEDVPDRFTHVVKSQDKDNGWIYHYSWVDLQAGALPKLINVQGSYLGKLI